MTEDALEELPYRRGVGVMLANRDSLVFAGQRIDSNLDAWQMPQGGIDKGEAPEEAALRELEEETGVTPDLVTVEAGLAEWINYDLPAEMVPKIWGGRYRGQTQRWFLFRFNGEDSQVNIETGHPEFSAWRWVTTEQLMESVVPFKRETYLRVVAGFREYLRP